jgi:hypothetical protein
LKRNIWGAGLEAGGEDSKLGNEAVTGLAAIVFATTGALIAALQDSGKTRPEFVLYYSFATLIPLFGMVSVLGTRAGKARRFYDDGTIRFTRSILTMCFILWAASVYLGFEGVLPGQPQKQIKYLSIYNAEFFRFSPESSGLVARAKLDIYPQGIPPEIELTVYIDEGLTDWEVAGAKLVGVSGQDRTTIRRMLFTVHTDYEYKIVWPKPPEDRLSESYEVEIYLRPRIDYAKEEIDSLAQELTEGKGLIVYDPRLQ